MNACPTLTTPLAPLIRRLPLPTPQRQAPRQTIWDYLTSVLSIKAPLGCEHLDKFKSQGATLIEELTDGCLEPHRVAELVEDLECYLRSEWYRPELLGKPWNGKGEPELPIWRDNLATYHLEHLITLRCTQIICRIDELDLETGRRLLEELIGSQLVEKAALRYYQGFPIVPWRLNCEYLGYTEF